MNFVPRASYPLAETFKVVWYPGHMKKAMRLLETEFKKVNLFIEVRDARVPITGQNPELLTLLPPKVKRIVLFNKIDLANEKQTLLFADRVRAEPGVSDVLHTSTKQNTNITRMIQYIKDKCVPEFRSVGAWLMIGGLPNVGKSTMINALRKRDTSLNHSKRSGAKAGAKPCLTRSITDYKIIADPPTYLLDSPGIIQPHLREGTDDALKLSAV